MLGYRGLYRFVGEISIPLSEFGRQLVAAALMGAVVAFLDARLSMGRVNTVLLVGMGALVYSALITGASSRVRGKISLLRG